MESQALVYRHNRITRLTHWIDALALTVLFMSGLMIFNAHPSLYWGDKSDPGTAFFSIGAVGDNGAARGVVQFYGRELDTTGVLGLQHTRQRRRPTRVSQLDHRAGILFARRRPALAFLFWLAVCDQRHALRDL